MEGGRAIDTEKVRELFTSQLRYSAKAPGFRREEENPVVRQISLYNEKSYISYSGLTTETAGLVIDRELEYFKRSSQAFEWKVYDYDKPAKLKEILQHKGFSCDEKEALMGMDMDEQEDVLYRQINSDVKELTSREEIMHLVELESLIWGETYHQLGDRLWRDKQKNPESLFLFGIYEKGILVSVAWMYLEPESFFVSLWGGSTLAEYRGKGYYTDLLTVRAQAAYEKGYIYLIVDAGPMSEPLLKKAGFEHLAYSWGCQSPSPESE